MIAGDKVAALLPHAGGMILIDRVERWDSETILCTTGSHLRAANPLRRSGRLSSTCGIEYGAQAIALHAALTGSGTARGGRLAALRGVLLHAARLDTLGETLTVTARRRMDGDGTAMYEFALSGGDMAVAEGRATVLLT